jgi:hypothetical protein
LEEGEEWKKLEEFNGLIFRTNVKESYGITLPYVYVSPYRL